MSVFVYSAGRGPAYRHYQRTVQAGVDLGSVLPFIADRTVADALIAAYPDGRCYLWGDRGGKHGRIYWDMMAAGDLAVCFSEKAIIAASFVVAKTMHPELAKFAWPDAEPPYQLLFFLTRPTFTNVPIGEVQKYFGQTYQGLRKSSKSDDALRDFGTLEAFVRRVLLGELYPLAIDSATQADSEYVPANIDTRAIAERLIRLRRGQPKFRSDLRERYGARCMVTACDAFDVVEAAHIRPYRGDNDHNPENGLLLRSDIHTLYDLDLLSIHPDTLIIELHSTLHETEYASLSGRALICNGSRPSLAALAERWALFQARALS